MQTKNDFRLFGDYIHEKGLKLHDIQARIVNYGLDEFRPPVPDNELQRYGLDAWAIDQINGPEPVLAMLCGELKLHATGIAMKDTTPQQYDMIQNSPIDSWVTSRSGYKITRRREYGPSATSASVRNVRNATVWTDQPVDISARRDLQDNIQGWTMEKEAFEQQNREMQVELAAIRDRISEIKKQQVRSPGERVQSMANVDRAILPMKNLIRRKYSANSKLYPPNLVRAVFNTCHYCINSPKPNRRKSWMQHRDR